MRAPIVVVLLFCTQLLAISLNRHLILSKGRTLQQLQGVKGVETDNGNAVQVKYEVKAGKGPYGGANMNRDPRASKNNASSSHFSRILYINTGISIGVGFFMPLLFGL